MNDRTVTVFGGTGFLGRRVVRHLDPDALMQSGRKTCVYGEALPNFNWSEPQAATLVGLTSRSLLELAIGIARGFIASGISRTRSTCRSPFSRLAPLTST